MNNLEDLEGNDVCFRLLGEERERERERTSSAVQKGS